MKLTPDTVVPFSRPDAQAGAPVLATSDVMRGAYEHGMKLAAEDPAFLPQVAAFLQLDRAEVAVPVQHSVIFGSAFVGPAVHKLITLATIHGPQVIGGTHGTLAIAGGVAVDGPEPELAAAANSYMESVGCRPCEKGELQADYAYDVLQTLAREKGVSLPGNIILSRTCTNSAQNLQAILRHNFGLETDSMPVQAIGLHGQWYHAHLRGPATLRKNMRSMHGMTQDQLPTIASYGAKPQGMTGENFHTFPPVIAGAVFAEYFRFHGGLNGEKPHMEQGHFDQQDLHDSARNLADIRALAQSPVRRLPARAKPRVLVA